MLSISRNSKEAITTGIKYVREKVIGNEINKAGNDQIV